MLIHITANRNGIVRYGILTDHTGAITAELGGLTVVNGGELYDVKALAPASAEDLATALAAGFAVEQCEDALSETPAEEPIGEEPISNISAQLAALPRNDEGLIVITSEHMHLITTGPDDAKQESIAMRGALNYS